ncbi:MAG TPA: DUF4215 domain-containing protein [bacterium]|nr:DUF4215 domain-containing protein [bacterium]
MKHIVILTVFLLWSGASWAATFTVTKTADTADGTCNADCSLREAISASNATSTNDVITLPAGTFPIQIASTCENFNDDGDIDIFTTTPGKTLTINGTGVATTIIDGNDVDRVFDLVSQSVFTPTVTINGVTVRDGTAQEDFDGCGVGGDGGGIRIGNLASLTMNDSVVEQNAADEGGGIYNNGSLTIDESTVRTNQSRFDGGGIGNTNVCLGTDILITNSTVSGNTAGDSTGNGSQGNGGGISSSSGEVRVVDSTISGNRAVGTDGAGNGGGLYVFSGACPATAILMNATITANTADFGGFFSGDGGGVAVEGQIVPALTALVVTSDELNLRNTIIAGNTDASTTGTLTPDCVTIGSAVINSEGFSLIGNETGCDGSFTGTGDQVGTAGSPINARLGPLANNGGPTQTHALLTTPFVSPAIDAANPAGCFTNDANSGSALTRDQRNAPRPLDGGPAGPSPARCDIGAFELGGCGDGFVAPTEECDDGNLTNGDGCNDTCQIEACGNGVLDAGEECDDGNVADGDGCSANCTNEVIPACGDDILQSGEECDDGNTIAGDGCAADCTLEPFCGDGTLDAGEGCDDGNKTNNDGCSSTCAVEPSLILLLGDGGCSLIRTP